MHGVYLFLEHGIFSIMKYVFYILYFLRQAL